MLFAHNFRQIARDSLNGRWPTAIGAGFIASLFGAAWFNNRMNIFELISEINVKENSLKSHMVAYRDSFMQRHG